MLSNQTSNLHHHQQHRRQNPTSTSDGVKVSPLPAISQQQIHHRRGLSLDQKPHSQPLRRQQSLQDDRTVSSNQELQQQHILREAQQQRLARPGQYHQDISNQTSPHYQYHTSQHTQSANHPNSVYEPYKEKQYTDINNLETHIPRTFESNNKMNFNILTEDIHTIAPDLHGFEEQIDRQARSKHHNGACDENGFLRDDSFENKQSLHKNAVEVPQRPHTPPNQCSTGYFPITPAPTPRSRSSKTQPVAYSRTTQSSPTRRDPNETIKGSRGMAMKRGSSYQEFFDNVTYHPRGARLPSPPNTVPLSYSSTFDITSFQSPNFMNMSTLKMNLSNKDNGYDSSHYSPMSKDASSVMSSFQSSPEVAHMDMFSDIGEDMLDFPILAKQPRLPVSQSAADLGIYSSQAKEELPPRSQSISELGLDLSNDASIEETGITVDEIASFIQGPEPIDGKWLCLFPECNKKFGRKENIKSHVQTHLGDRQFRCNHCKKCFVRQHDLKRHSKIHSGVKPYPCACGNSFARHDALTRHRQRNMCIGGIGVFEGTVRQEVKRGRPKKMNRPDTEERREKAARTRQRVLEKTYASPRSGSSEGSFSSPPTYDDLEMRDDTPSRSLEALEPMSGVSPDVMFSYTPPASPKYSTGDCLSRSHSQQSYPPNAFGTNTLSKRGSIASKVEEAELLLPVQSSPCKSVASQYGTPPELELASSSPAASRFFDYDYSSEAADYTIKPNNTSQDKGSSSSFDLPGLNNVDQMFLGSFGDTPLIDSFVRDTTLLLDDLNDPFASGNAWASEYTERSDPFFGSP